MLPNAQVLLPRVDLCFSIRFVPEGEVLFEVSSFGTEFFFIMEGKVVIAIDIIKSEIQEATLKELKEREDVALPEKPIARFKSTFPGVPKSPPVEHSVVLRKQTGYHVIHKGRLLQNVNTLPEGKSFGDVALTKNGIRNATILAGANCYLGVLDKENYTRIIGEYLAQLMKKKHKFISRLPLFVHFSNKDIETISPEFQEETFHYRDVILKAGQKITKLYSIISGKVKILKKMETHNKMVFNKEDNLYFIDNQLNKEQRYIQVVCLPYS